MSNKNKDSISQVIKKRLKAAGQRFWASDNISAYIKDGEKQQLIDEAAAKFEAVLQSLVIDTDNDPNSRDTGRRLAKMYFNEIMAGRYDPAPKVTGFPNTDPETRYDGILNIRVELKSLCSHHHQPVRGVAFIGIIPSTQVIGLSKYARLAQWCARRGTLQEELASAISKEIKKATKTDNVGVYIQMTHGCMENRGVCAHSSLTQTTVLSGMFRDASTREEWMKQIQLQIQTTPP